MDASNSGRVIVVNAVIIRGGELLIVKKRGAWILPGGKIKEGEYDFGCLRREVAEELSGTRINPCCLYDFFYGCSPHRRSSLQARVYFAELAGFLGPATRGDSVSESSWLDRRNEGCYALSGVSRRIVCSLITDEYL